MRSFLTAMHFLTRLKIYNNTIFIKEDYQKSVLYFPLIGLIIGVFLAILAYGSEFILQPFTTAVLLITFEAILTGGLHLDGFMDSCDGLFSGRDRDKMLDIMKDSRVGAMGVLSVIILLLLKLALLIELPRMLIVPIIVIMPMLGRMAMVYCIFRFPYARSEGLGSIFQSTSRKSWLYPAIYSLLIFLIVIPIGFTYLVLPLLILSIEIIARRINTILGGFTGDNYGMINEITEVIFLFWCVLISRI